MLVVLLAPPGSGKGTQVKFLQEQFGFHALSGSGVLSEAKKDPTLSRILGAIENVQASGNLVGDCTMNELMVHYSVKISPQKRLVLDGFPRTSGQVRGLQQICSRRLSTTTFSHDRFFTLLFEGVEPEQAWQWVEEGRAKGTRSMRPDDTPGKMMYRHELYQKELPGILEGLPKSRVFRVDATRSKEGVSDQIMEILGLNDVSRPQNPYPAYPDSASDTVYHPRELVATTDGVEQPEPGCGA